MSHDLLLNLKDLACDYASQKMVRGLDLHLNAGGIGCLPGPSGCGRTATLCAIADSEPVLAGQIELGGEVISRLGFTLAPEKRRIGTVFQNYAPFPHLSVTDDVGFDIRKHPQRERLVHELPELVKLGHLVARHPHGLPDGQQQRMVLARALAPEPLLLLLDEPFSNLDVELCCSLGRGIHEVLKTRDTNAILVTHDREETSAVCGHIGMLKEGHLEQWDTSYDLYHEPLTPFITSFVGQGCFIRGQLLSSDTMQTELNMIRDNRAYSLPSGSAIDVLLRPDDPVHAPQGELKARIVGRTFLSATTLYRLQLPTGAQLRSIFFNHADHQSGDDVGIRVAADHLVAFATRGSAAAHLAPVQA